MRKQTNVAVLEGLEGRVRVVVGDITRQEVDALVNAANSSLMGGGGVDGAIHRAGGPTILKECRELRRSRYPDGLPTGEAIATSGGELFAKHVIHTVGPVYGRENGREPELLSACYRNSLAVAIELQLDSVAFPSISTGLFSYPREEAAAVSSATIRDFLQTNGVIREVRLVFFSPADAEVFIRNHKFEI